MRGFKEEYQRSLFGRIVFAIVLAVCVVLVIGLLSVTSFKGLTLSEAYGIIWAHIQGSGFELHTREWWADYHIWNVALPRACVAMVAGMSLAVAGVVMQAILNNPVADPYVTGISSGACFGAVAAIVAGASYASIATEFGIVADAFMGAMVPATIIILFSRRIGNSPATMILAGIAISYFFNALVTYLMVMADVESLQEAYLWQVGSLSGISWHDLPVMLSVTLIGCLFFMVVARQLNVLTIGDKEAKTLGIDVSSFRTICLLMLALMAAVVISHTGIIGFIGLVAPHMVRLFVGSDNRYVIPLSMLAGALLLLLSDYLALTVSGVSDVPVGVITSLIGSPVFLLLLLRQGGTYGRMYRWGPGNSSPNTAGGDVPVSVSVVSASVS